jgi:ribose transport system permease protein
MSQATEHRHTPSPVLADGESSGLTPHGMRRAVGAAAERAGLHRFAGVYLIVILVTVFCMTEPQFRTVTNARVLLGSQAIVGILTLALVISLISGAFDLSIAANMSLAISLVGWLQGSADVGAFQAVVLTLLVGGLVGAVNAFVVTVLRVDAIIATLGMSAILAAVAYALVDGQTIIDGISEDFTTFGTARLASLPITVYYLFAVAVILWYLLEHTPWGRYLRATGTSPTVTKLAGVRIVRLQWSALLVSGMLAALAGVVLTMQLGAASFGAGNSYLLPAFAAAFLGTTQIQPGRFNVWGTLVALYLLAVAVKGLQLRYPGTPWIANLITGLVLVVSVALVARTRRNRT